MALTILVKVGDRICLVCNCSCHINIRIDVSEGIHVHKTNKSREYIISNYHYFPKVDLRFQTKVCSGCHNLMQKATNNLTLLQLFLLNEMLIELIFGI